MLNMKFFNKTTGDPPTWVRGTMVGSNSQLPREAGARPMFSNPLDEEVYDTSRDQRQGEYMSIKETRGTDKSQGGVDA